MKQITSTEFQKTYSRLIEPHEVTALGRVIGTYYPVGTLRDYGPGQMDARIEARSPGAFGAPRPAPKPSKGKTR